MSMTLEEAIASYEKSAERYHKAFLHCKAHGGEFYQSEAESNRICAEHDRQLAEWLRELQERRKADRWIPTSERLPDKEFEAGLLNGTVFDLFPCLVTRYATHSPVDPKRLYVAKHYYDGNDFVNNAVQECTEAVIAWRPLPEPYEAERRTDD